MVFDTHHGAEPSPMARDMSVDGAQVGDVDDRSSVLASTVHYPRPAKFFFRWKPMKWQFLANSTGVLTHPSLQLHKDGFLTTSPSRRGPTLTCKSFPDIYMLALNRNRVHVTTLCLWKKANCREKKKQEREQRSVKQQANFMRSNSLPISGVPEFPHSHRVARHSVTSLSLFCLCPIGAQNRSNNYNYLLCAGECPKVDRYHGCTSDHFAAGRNFSGLGMHLDNDLNGCEHNHCMEYRTY